MPSIPIISELADILKLLPTAAKEIPAQHSKARADLIESVTTLAEAVSQALNVVASRCGRMALHKNDLDELKRLMVDSPQLLNDFRLNGVCTALSKVRADLRTILDMKTFSIRLFYKKRLEVLLEQVQNKERSLEEDFDVFFRDLSMRAASVTESEVPEIIQYLRDCQLQFEEDNRILRHAMRKVENSI